MFSSEIFCPVLMCTYITMADQHKPHWWPQIATMKKSNFSGRWEIKGGGWQKWTWNKGQQTTDMSSALLLESRHITNWRGRPLTRRRKEYRKVDEMIREQTRPTSRFFPFKLILAVSTAYLFVKPGQMLGEMSETFFPLYWAITSWMEMTLFPNNSTISFGPKMYYLL